MSIPLDTYFIVTPGTEFKSKAYGTLNGTDLFFYITDTGSLRVVNMNSTVSSATPGLTSFTLDQHAKWVGGVVSLPGVCHLYYCDQSGTVKYIKYTALGAISPPQFLGIAATVVTFSVNYAPNCIPAAFIMAIDDGVNHNLYAATDPEFQNPTGSPVRIFSNLLDNTHYTVRPAIAVHPDDTKNITIHCQQIKVSDGSSKVGFYVAVIPGVA